MADLTADNRAWTEDGKIIGLVSVAHFMSHLFQLVLPPLFPVLKDALGVGYAELGGLIMLMYAASGLAQTPAGMLVDRFGPARILIAGLGILSAAVLLYGLAPSYWALIPLAIVAGLGNAVFHPADYAILTARVGATRLGRAYGAHTFGGALGYAAAPIAILGLAGILGWRGALSVLGLVGLALTLVLIAQREELATETPRRTAGPSAAAAGAVVSPGLAGGIASPGLTGGIASPGLAGVILSPPILLCFAYFTLLAVALIGMQSFMPTALVTAFGVSVETANMALTCFLLASAIGILAGGFALDRFGRPDMTVALGLAIAAIFTLAAGFVQMPIAVLTLCIGVAGFASGFSTPSRDMLVRGATPAGATGKVFGFVYSGLDAGSAITPPILGWMIDREMPRSVFGLVAAAYLIAVATAFIVGQGGRAKRPAPMPTRASVAGPGAGGFRASSQPPRPSAP